MVTYKIRYHNVLTSLLLFDDNTLNIKNIQKKPNREFNNVILITCLKSANHNLIIKH